MQQTIAKLVEKIKTKHFKNLDEKVIKDKIQEIISKNKKLAKAISEGLNEKSAEFKLIVKTVKQEMHYSYGAFQKETSSRDKLLEELKNSKDKEDILEIHKKLLATHSSTKERLEIYNDIYGELFLTTGVPESILDLGCGLNPLSLPWMYLKKIKYIASEFNEDDTEFIKKYFAIIEKQNKGYDLEATTINLKKDIDRLKFIKVDVVFAWKLFDLLKTKEVEAVVNAISAKYLIASFSTKTLSRKDMGKPQRTWFEMMLNRLHLEFEIKEFENEIFYIISY